MPERKESVTQWNWLNRKRLLFRMEDETKIWNQLGEENLKNTLPADRRQDMTAQGFVMDRAEKYNKFGFEMKDKT